MAAFLLPPDQGLPAARVEPELLARALDAHRRLLAGDIAGATAGAEPLLGLEGGASAATVVLAGADLARGSASAAIARLAPLLTREPGYAAAQLLLARAHELNGHLRAAFDLYVEVESAAAVAQERARVLLPPAAREVRSHLEDALARGEVAPAALLLAWLERWLPGDPATIDARRRLAAQAGDAAQELAALRRLVVTDPENRELLRRQGELELQVGDAGRGLALFEGLARRYPADPEIAREVGRARFLWRLSTLPPRVQAAVRRESPTRADFAALLYWLVPGVRTGRPGATRVATDVLDHPWREEIVRVVNFGLLRVDETLHLFDPDRALSRGDADLALSRVLFLFGRGAPCVRSHGAAPGSISREGACALLTACGVTGDPDRCSEGRPVSGAAILEELRRTLDLLDGGGA